MKQHKGESRLHYLARVLTAFMNRNQIHNSIKYDDAICDGACLAEDIFNEAIIIPAGFDWKAVHHPLVWANEKPTEPGWYWIREPQPHGLQRSRVVHVRLYSGKLCIENWEIPSNAEWAGPIQKPMENEK